MFIITSELLRRSARQISGRTVRASHHARQLQSFGNNSIKSLDSDLSSDDNSPLIDERTLKQLPSYKPSDFDARILRSRLPPQIQLHDLGAAAVFVPKRETRTMPRMEVDVEEENASDSYTQSLPKTINDIDVSDLDQDPRAIVVTETKTPFRVTQVNTSWESLCGYAREECKGRSLGSLLNGPETNKMAATALISKLLLGEEAGVILTNYTKSGRKFKNYVRVGPVVDEMGKTINFVGVLREVGGTEKGTGVAKSVANKLPFMS